MDGSQSPEPDGQAVLKATGCSDGFLHGLVVPQSVLLA